MTDTMAPGASSDCTKAYPIASDAPTTSPSHGNTSSVHGESPRPIPEKRYVLSHTHACTTPLFRLSVRATRLVRSRPNSNSRASDPRLGKVSAFLTMLS